MFVFDPDFFLSVATQASAKIECQIHLKVSPDSAMQHKSSHTDAMLFGGGKLVDTVDSAVARTDGGTAGARPYRLGLRVSLHRGAALSAWHLEGASADVRAKARLAAYGRSEPPNFFCIAAATATEWTDHFLSSNRNGEITFACTPSTCVARSKDDDSPDPKGGLRRAIHTEVKIAVDEFREYAVLEACALTFSLREFNATWLWQRHWVWRSKSTLAMETNRCS